MPLFVFKNVMYLTLSNLKKMTGIAVKHIQVRGLRYSAASFWRELWFDLTRGIDTTFPEQLSPSAHSVHYQGADPSLVNQLLQRLPSRAKTSTFIDFGSGKGRVLLLAMEHGFAKVIGVEISPDLSAICRRNLKRFTLKHPASNLDVIETDAATLKLPPGPLTAFFFNPFHGPPLEQVAENLASHADIHGAEVWLIYINPIHSNVFLERGFTHLHSIEHEDATVAVLAHKQSDHAYAQSQAR